MFEAHVQVAATGNVIGAGFGETALKAIQAADKKTARRQVNTTVEVTVFKEGKRYLVASDYDVPQAIKTAKLRNRKLNAAS